MLASRLVALIMLVALPIMSVADDLGVIGQTWPIIEMDFLDFIHLRLNAMQKNGELQKIQDRFSKDVARHANRPVSVSNICRTVSNKSWTVDPSITVSHDMKDMEGHVFARAGTVVNPLDYITIHHQMIFIDADDADQIRWVRNKMGKRSEGIKLVLVNGSVSDTAEIIQQPVYFDQEGRLTSRFHIQHVPAIVSQQEKHLLIQEVTP